MQNQSGAPTFALRTDVLKRAAKLSAVTAAVTLVFAVATPNQYRSEARILPADQRSAGGLGQMAAAAAAVGVAIPGQESADSAYVDILNSRHLREGLLKTQFSFPVRTWYLGREQPREQTLMAYLKAKNTDQGLRLLAARISISRDVKSKLITISAETTSPRLSQQMVQWLLKALDEFVMNKSKTKGGIKAAFAEKRLAEARKDMAASEDAFRAYLEGNRNYLVSADPAVRLRGLRLENELKLKTQLVTTLALTREQALLEEKNDMPIINVLDGGNLPEEKSRPARASWLLTTVLLTSAGALLWGYRDWIRARFAEDGVAGTAAES